MKKEIWKNYLKEAKDRGYKRPLSEKEFFHREKQFKALARMIG